MCDTVFFLLDFHFIMLLLHVNAIYNMNSVNVYYCMDCYMNLIFPLYNVIRVLQYALQLLQVINNSVV